MSAIPNPATLIRLALLLVAAGGVAVALGVHRQRTVAILRDYFGAETHAVNLAVFRIVVFGTVLVMVWTEAAVWFSRLPRELLVPPPGLGPVLARLPIDPTIVGTARLALAAVAVLGLLGIFTRTAAALAFLLGLYVFGVPQFYGKITHDLHHVIWFLALLAVSPADHALSLRSLLSDAPDPPPSRAYALPLRLAWLLMGLIYFFPGFWKLWNAGPGWLSGEALIGHLRFTWLGFDGWTPFFRVDRYPLLAAVGGVLTVLFEISFVFLVLFRRTRPWAALAGVSFHTVTNALMRIPFWQLHIMYVTFVDWHALPARLRALLGRPSEMPTAPTSSAPAAPLGAEPPSDATAPPDGAVPADATAPGDGAMPSVWAVSAPVQSAAGPRRSSSTRAVAAIGALVLASNAAAGALAIDSWPIAVYPRFDHVPRETARRITISFATGDGAIQDLDPVADGLWAPGENDRYAGLQVTMVHAVDDARRREMLSALWRFWQRREPRLADATAVRFHMAEVPLDPDEERDRSARELLHEIRLRTDPPDGGRGRGNASGEREAERPTIRLKANRINGRASLEPRGRRARYGGTLSTG